MSVSSLVGITGTDPKSRHDAGQGLVLFSATFLFTDLYLSYPPRCGSELARDSGLTVDIVGEWKAVIASKLAPTGGVSKSIKDQAWDMPIMDSGLAAGYRGTLLDKSTGAIRMPQKNTLLISLL
ncbi:hypothetical protein D3C85_1027650 [compost metagenome]